MLLLYLGIVHQFLGCHGFCDLRRAEVDGQGSVSSCNGADWLGAWLVARPTGYLGE